MPARYVRFVRLLALATAGCEGGFLLKPDAVSSSDSVSDSDSDSVSDSDSSSDSAPDAPADTVARPDADGVCRTITADAGPDLPCPSGGACSYPDDAGEPRCTFDVDAAGRGSNLECGGITCGEYCYCAGPAASVCGCLHGAIGPLSPPDLPSIC